MLSLFLRFLRNNKTHLNRFKCSSVQVFNRFKMKVLSNFEYGLVGYPKLESDQYPPPMVMTMGWLATQTLEHEFYMVITP